MWVWIVAGLVFLLLAFILVWCIPLDVVLTFDSTSEKKFRLRLTWLFGMIGFEVLPYFNRLKKKKRPGRFSPRKLLALIRIKGLTRRAWLLSKDICSKVRIKELASTLRFGLGEPALTGILYGVISATRPLLRLPPQYRMEIEPSFTSQYILEGHARCILSLQPVRMVLPFCRFIFSPPGRRAARIMLSRR